MTPVTQTGAVLGTPAYMAPEQFAGAPVDARADQFAFCVTAWEALWNERPFAGASYAQLARRDRASATRRPPPSTPKVPARVRLALERGLSVESGRRGSRRCTRCSTRCARRTAGAGAGWSPAGAVAAAARRRRVALLRGAAARRRASSPASPSSPRCATDLPALLRQHGATRIADQRRGAPARATPRRSATTRGRLRGRPRPRVVARDRRAEPESASRSARAPRRCRSPAPIRPEPMDVLRHLRRLPPEDHCRNQTYLASRPPLPSDPEQLDDADRGQRHARRRASTSVEDHDFAAAAPRARRARGVARPRDPGIAAGMTRAARLARVTTPGSSPTPASCSSMRTTPAARSTTSRSRASRSAC